LYPWIRLLESLQISNPEATAGQKNTPRLEDIHPQEIIKVQFPS
jgi:hypothetical protein